MEGELAHAEQLFYTRSADGNYHIIVGNQETAICRQFTVKRTGDGGIDPKKCRRFDSFDAKPSHKWCQNCRRTAEQRGLV